VLIVVVVIVVAGGVAYWVLHNRRTTEPGTAATTLQGAAAANAQKQIEAAGNQYKPELAAQYLELASNQIDSKNYDGARKTLDKIPDSVPFTTLTSKYSLLLSAAMVEKNQAEYTKARTAYKAALTTNGSTEAKAVLVGYDTKYPAQVTAHATASKDDY